MYPALLFCSLKSRWIGLSHLQYIYGIVSPFIILLIHTWINSLTDIFIHSWFHRLIDKLSHLLMVKSSIQLFTPLTLPDLNLALFKQGMPVPILLRTGGQGRVTPIDILAHTTHTITTAAWKMRVFALFNSINTDWWMDKKMDQQTDGQSLL